MPHEFVRLTPRELVLLTDGARAQDERRVERLAWALAHLMNCWGAKVTVKELLGREDNRTTEDKVVELLRGQYEAEGKDPEQAPKALSPGQKLDVLMGGMGGA